MIRKIWTDLSAQSLTVGASSDQRYKENTSSSVSAVYDDAFNTLKGTDF